MTFPLSTVLIANRGEIAVRIARTARELGIRSIAVYSEADRGALHTRVADEAWALEGSTSAETYMNIPALLSIAAKTGADCIHPGYGFLAEDSDFARQVIAAGLRWVGPSPEAIDLLGDKVAARKMAIEAGAPLAPGTSEPLESWEEARDFAQEYGLPIAIKAAFGGGGRGIKVVHEMEDIEQAFRSAGREATEAFGRGECYVEKFLTRPRHVEAQVIADTHGNTLVLGTRDCSVQRRFQKLIEEAPAPFLSKEQERSIIEGSRKICQAADYVGAGTVEYIVSEDGTVSFLEVNTRVQVEHPITEELTGVDIVAEQFRAAAGLELSITEDPVSEGHAFEFRINAEDAANGFVPSPGTVAHFEPPTGPGLRIDTGIRSGGEIPGYYDSLLAKLIVRGKDRESALKRAKDALEEFDITGVRTVIPFHLDMVEHPAFAGDHLGVYTSWVDTEYEPGAGSGFAEVEAFYEERTRLTLEIDGKLHTVGIPTAVLNAGAHSGAPLSQADAPENADAPEGVTIVPAPFAGSLVQWSVDDGAEVEEGQTIAVIEAMKMESNLSAPSTGVLQIQASAGQQFRKGESLGTIS